SFGGRWGVRISEPVAVICYPPGEFARRTGLHEEVGGAFDGRIRIAFPDELREGGLELSRVVRHEAIHLLLHRIGSQPPPRWLDEGLAQLYDGEDREPWRGRFRELLAAQPNVAVDEREGFDKSRDLTNWAALYLHSYFFCRHLLDTGHDFRLDMMLREVTQGRTWTEAFAAVYGASVREIDQKWRRALSEPVEPR
ncbi:MAG: hypothetical protein KDC38_11440, partial [Planctomycetes bacterium]|nr:hypothetical protein [Planctomycetota bacterium]